VLQAFATRKALQNTTDAKVDTLNYRLQEQSNFYALYRFKYGIKTTIKDLGQIPIQSQRKRRAREFERFIKERLGVTRRMTEPSEVAKMWGSYNTLVSGSDQVWNKNSLELRHADWKYMDPYLLKGFPGRKISYASSIGDMSDSDLSRIIPAVQEFEYVSMREEASARTMGKLLGRPISAVIDPTFLLTKDEWVEKLELSIPSSDKYILYYSLSGVPPVLSDKKILLSLAKERDCKVKVVTPFVYLLRGSVFETCAGLSPEEFLQLILGADLVVTDSYHGTALAVNFEKPFYCLCEHGGAEYRKTDLINRLGLNTRILFRQEMRENEPDISGNKVDFEEARSKLTNLRQKSYEYLRLAIR